MELKAEKKIRGEKTNKQKTKKNKKQGESE